MTNQPANTLPDYVIPVSVDTFGSYPNAKPGDRFVVEYLGKVYTAIVQQGHAMKRANGTVLRDMRFRQVEGPVSRFGQFA